MKLPQVFQKQSFLYAAAGFALSGVLYFGLLLARPLVHEYQTSFAAREFKEYGVAGTYRKHFFSFLDRLHNLQGLEQENATLRAQLADLEKRSTLAEAASTERDLASLNEHLEEKLQESEGSAEARLPQTLSYAVPEHLTSLQLYTLAIGYFRKQEYEKSAVIFNHLLKLADEHTYERAENYLMNGISWFHLKDYTLSLKMVEEAKHHSKETAPVHRQAILWQAMVEKAMGKDKLSQATLLNFIGRYPHSEEGRAINLGRKPSNQEVKQNETSIHE